MSVVAVGVPAWPEITSGWNLWPVVGIGLSLLILRRVVHLRFGPSVLLTSIVAGSFFALAVDAWGIPAALMVVLLVMLSLGGMQRAVHRRRD